MGEQEIKSCIESQEVEACLEPKPDEVITWMDEIQGFIRTHAYS
jgi:hypothetical protein